MDGSGKALTDVSRAAMLAAAAVVNGLLLVVVPNVELVTATVAVAGLLLGPVHGFFVGVFAAGIFGAINPVGSSLAIPSLWVAQMLGQGLNGLLFGLFRGGLLRLRGLWRAPVYGALGVAVTVLYQLLLSLSFWLFAPPSGLTLMAFLLGGLAFTLTQIVINGLIFALLVPVAVSRLRTLLRG